MEKRINDKLETFFKENGEHFGPELIELVNAHMDEFLEGKKYIDLLGQVAFAIGETPKNGDLFSQYFAFLKENFDLNGNVLEVGSGYYPAVASLIDEYQQNTGKGSIEIYDPNTIVTKKGNIKINRAKFDYFTNTSRFSLITSMFPCEPTIDIIHKANSEDKDFSIMMCQCVPNENSMFYMHTVSPETWQNHVYEIAKSTARTGREIGIAHVDKVDTPIIYSKRKK